MTAYIVYSVCPQLKTGECVFECIFAVIRVNDGPHLAGGWLVCVCVLCTPETANLISVY